MIAVPAFPLQWPAGVPRAKGRRKSQFRTSISSALGNVRDSLRLFGNDSGKVIADTVISSNFTLGVSKPEDPGVAVWFVWDGETRCIAVDLYEKAEENLQAIHHVLEARRTEMRHAGIVMARASMAGFAAALPPPGYRPWWDVLRVKSDATEAEIDAAYRKRAAVVHPDKPGGSTAAMTELNAARDAARKERAR